ncbi:hypothetical protein F5Y10DRAFT_234632 [Nemania abortiva]|nr:hypothetical protein F5Y10DRAFT_234632 [Nemania abortiva]
MIHTKHLFTPARALHRVLLLELANAASKSIGGISSSTLQFSSSCALRNYTPRSPSPSPPKHARAPRVTTPPSCRRLRAFSTTFPAAAQRVLLKRQKHLRNTDIPYRWVRIASSETGTLSPPQSLDSALSRLPPGHSLIMVAPPPANPPAPAPGSPLTLSPSAAICKVVDDAAERAAEKAVEREARRAAQGTKTLELGWAIAAHDLGHKMTRLRAFLEKGLRVEVLLARKRGARKATAEESQELVRSIRAHALDVAGTTEFKKVDGFVGGVLKMFFEGPPERRKEKKEKEKGGGE